MAKRKLLGMLAAATSLALACSTHAHAEAAIASSAPSAAPSPAQDSPQFEDAERVGKLIQSLGSGRYIDRRQAQQQLMEIGMRAFDQIDAATTHPDPEISASCRYLVSELTVRWTRRDDSPEVKAVLDNYASKDESARLDVVLLLSQQFDRWAIAPLCRICRYDPSRAVSREAAASLLRAELENTGYDAETAAVLEREIGTSVRPAAEWVRLLALQIESPQAAADAWPAAIDRVVAAAATEVDDETYDDQITRLLRNLARLEIQLGDRDSLLAVVDRLLQHATPVAELPRLLRWAQASPATPEGQASPLADDLISRYEAQLTGTKGGLYLMAGIRARQGRDEEATDWADRAFAIDGGVAEGDTPEQRFLQGVSLIEDNHVGWGRRELRAAIEEEPIASEVHSLASVALSDSLHDWQEDEQAADVLDALTSRLKADNDLRTQYEGRVRNAARMSQLGVRIRPLQELESYQYYYRACHYAAEGRTEDQWNALKGALRFDEENADIIIGMYHASEGDDTRREEVLETIRERCRMLEQSIADHPSFASRWYNEWAWLVSNTEGDFEKAVRYSHQSVDLLNQQIAADPTLSKEDAAGVLDTLGRCYFAAGDLDQAIKYQSLAVEYQPHMQVMQRQLAEFKAAKQARDG